MHPIGPAPVMSTSSPTRSNESAVWTALPNGSKIDSTSRGMFGRQPDIGHREGQELGEAARAIDADALRVLAKWRRPARQLRQWPQTTCPSPLTRCRPRESPWTRRADLDDLADELVPDDHRHRDRLLGPGIPLINVQIGAADRRSHDPMRTSLMPTVGTGTSSSQSPHRLILDQGVHRLLHWLRSLGESRIQESRKVNVFMPMKARAPADRR